MTHPDSSPTSGMGHDSVHLRLVWPQWQGAGTSSVEAFAPEFPLYVARREYAVGPAVLDAVLPPHDGPTETVPVTLSDDGLEERDGVEANEIMLGLGPEPDGLTSAEVRRIVADIDRSADVVGCTIAEFIPRQVMHLQLLLNGFPLISGTSGTTAG